MGRDSSSQDVSGPTATNSRNTVVKVIATVAVVVGAVGGLVFFSLDSSAATYMHVDEALAEHRAEGLEGKRLQVHGYVVKDSIEQKPGTLEYRFRIETKPPRAAAEVTAYYTGIVPDTFKSEAEVVATGYLKGADRLEVVADGIMAKCPSRYEGKDKSDLIGDESVGERTASNSP